MLTNSSCEAWKDKNWTVVSVQYAISRPGLIVRCLECHGPIVLMRAGRNNTTRAHAEHKPGHSGCSLGVYFNGTKTRNPNPVVEPSTSEENEYHNQAIVSIEDDESSFAEGQEKFRLHRYYERDGKIVKKAKAKRLSETKKLSCDVCGFDFYRIYGELGAGYIEAHHRIPVSSLKSRKRTKIEDLALVCSNCHRMLHRSDPLMSVEQLKELILPKLT